MVPLALVPNLVTRGRHLHKYQAGEVTQVMESIPWVRCASGNFLFPVQQFINRFPKVVVGDISFIDSKVDHQVHCYIALESPLVSHLERSGPIDRTPGTPGTDENMKEIPQGNPL